MSSSSISPKDLLWLPTAVVGAGIAIGAIAKFAAETSIVFQIVGLVAMAWALTFALYHPAVYAEEWATTRWRKNAIRLSP